jgi:hypothetical protein
MPLANAPGRREISAAMTRALCAVFTGAALLLGGCTASSSKNLTPRTIPLTPTRTYPFEIEWDSVRRGVRPEDVRAFVMVDQQLYPMTPVPVARNRWEAQIPVAEGRTYVPYKYKFEYRYPGVTTRHSTSVWSPEYRLVIPQQ